MHLINIQCISTHHWIVLAVLREMHPDVTHPHIHPHIYTYIYTSIISFLLADRLRELRSGTTSERQARKDAFIQHLKTLPIAIQTQDANEQHVSRASTYHINMSC